MTNYSNAGCSGASESVTIQSECGTGTSSVQCAPFQQVFTTGFLVVTSYDDEITSGVCTSVDSTTFYPIGVCIPGTGKKTSSITSSLVVVGNQILVTNYNYAKSNSCQGTFSTTNEFYSSSCLLAAIATWVPNLSLPDVSPVPQGNFLVTKNYYRSGGANPANNNGDISACGPVATEAYTAVGTCFAGYGGIGSEQQIVYVIQDQTLLQYNYLYDSLNCNGNYAAIILTTGSVIGSCARYTISNSIPYDDDVSATSLGSGYLTVQVYNTTSCEDSSSTIHYNYVGCTCEQPSSPDYSASSYSAHTQTVANSDAIVVQSFLSNNGCTGTPTSNIFIYFNASSCVGGINATIQPVLQYPQANGYVEL